MATTSNNELRIVGVNYHKTSLEIRNKFAFSPGTIQKIYQETKNALADDFFILSTCNRTEIYTTSNAAQSLLQLFADYKDLSPAEIAECTFIKEGDEAVRHLYKVAAGLDSQILGDHEIVRQIKNAFAVAKENNMVSGMLEKLVSEALKASKQIKAQTNISDGTTSISYAVVKLLKQEAGEETPKNICLMGLGKIGALTLKNLRHYAPTHSLTLINRDESKAEVFAADYGVQFATAEAHQDVLAASDILIVATGADHPLVTRDQIENSAVRMIFDLSVPSNLDADVKNIEGLKLFDIDQLSKIVDETIENRKQQVPLAIGIIEQNIEEYKEWQKRRSEYLTKRSEEPVSVMTI